MKLERSFIMTESNVNNDCLIEIGEAEEESLIAANNVTNHQTLRGNRNEDKVGIASSIRAKLRSEAQSSASACIYRIPDPMKRLHEKEFVPSLVSIGPFHHGKKNLQAMERVKLGYLSNLLVRLESETSLEHIVEKVASMEEYCRSCYEEKLQFSSEAFVEMMVVDGCFVVEFFRREEGKVAKDKDDPKDDDDPESMTFVTVLYELLLLELPWRLVDCLFELTNNQVPHGKKPKSLWELSCSLFSRWVDKIDPEKKTSEPRHLLDTVRLVTVEPDDKEIVLPVSESLPSATELVEIGVIFKHRGPDNKLGINFNNVDGVMEITPITITPNQSLLRNLIALEECESRGPHKYQITSYCRVLNDLIKSSKDVEILMNKNIIINFWNLSKEDIASFFSDICKNSVTTFSCSRSVSMVSTNVRTYYENRWLRRWIASIKREYLYNPSSIWSISNAVVLVILLTAIQTVYSVLSYYKS